jgi:hypothetical protein
MQDRWEWWVILLWAMLVALGQYTMVTWWPQHYFFAEGTFWELFIRYGAICVFATALGLGISQGDLRPTTKAIAAVLSTPGWFLVSSLADHHNSCRDGQCAWWQDWNFTATAVTGLAVFVIVALSIKLSVRILMLIGYVGAAAVGAVGGYLVK